MPGTCEGQDLNQLKALRLAVAAERKRTGKGRLPRDPCDPSWCFIEATGGKRCPPGKCRFSGAEKDKPECKRVKARDRMARALEALTEALADAARDGVVTAEEKARIRALEAWLAKLRKEK